MQNNHPIPIDLLFFLPRETKASDVFQAGSKGLSGGNNTLTSLVELERLSKRGSGEKNTTVPPTCALKESGHREKI